MYRYLAVGACIVLFAGVSHAQTVAATSCLEDDRGYQLIKADGAIDPVRLYGLAVKKFLASSLNNQPPSAEQVRKLGVTTGDAREWARLFVMICKQESGCRIARTLPDGTLEKFGSTPPNERSYGPLQYNIGEYGLRSWAMVNSPSCTLDAFIRTAQQNKLVAYFGSIQRPQEIMQHASWFNRTVQPFQDALTLTFDPNAPNNAAAYRAVTPYFVSTPNSNSPFNLGLTNSGTGGLSVFSSQLAYPSSPFSASQQILQNPTQANNNLPTGSGNLYAAKILVQPKNARVGQPVVVSWTSVNMNASATCRVVFDNQGVDSGPVFGVGSEGTKAWTATAGTHTFDLICLPKNASVFSITESITIPQ